MKKLALKPGNARVVVQMTAIVEVGGYGPEWTMEAAVVDAVKSAESKLRFKLKDSGITIGEAQVTRVVHDATTDRFAPESRERRG